MTITLERLVEVARAKTAADREVLPSAALLERLRETGALDRQAGRLVSALRSDGIGVIAEVKGASPVAGQLRADYDAAAIARQYQAAGAAAVSVLTEATYFGGSLEALEQVAAAVEIPVLRKDFIVEPYQIHQAALGGASAVLLIAEVLTEPELVRLVAVAREFGLDAIVEVHRADSVAAALTAGSGIVGVNNRNLETMTVDWRHALGVASELPPDIVRVVESGISVSGQLVALAAAGYDAALVGSSLMAAADPGQALETLIGEVAMTPRWKVCGVVEADIAREAVAAGADAVGFVFYPPSPRAVTAEQAAEIAAQLPRETWRMGVFVDAHRDEIERVIELVGLDFVQLSGDEDPAAAQGLSRHAFKALRVGQSTSVDEARSLAAPFDSCTLLVDTAVAGQYGGTGQTANWTAAAALAREYRLMLAGGLTIGNVAEAIDVVRPWAIDVSSGLETAPGRKSPRLIREFASVLETLR